MLGQALSFRWGETDLSIVLFRRTLRILCLRILPIPREPVVVEELIEEHLLLVPDKQRALERIVEIFPVGDINVVQCFSQVKQLARPHIDTGLPENPTELCQAVEQALTALYIDLPQWLRGKV